jgi:hypothetical protein
VDKEDLLQIEFIAQVLLVPSLISKQVVTACQAKYYLGQELKTHKLYLDLHQVLKTRAFLSEQRGSLADRTSSPSPQSN